MVEPDGFIPTEWMPVSVAVSGGKLYVATAKGRASYDRVLARFSRPDRAIAIYDGFGSVIDATPDVRRGLGPISPLVGEAITKNVPARAFVIVWPLTHIGWL